MTQKHAMQFLFLCFLLSGAAGLIYEVVWARQMALFLGITTYANTAIIAAFMIGLSVGSVTIGRFSDRFKNPLWIYIVLEVGIGIYAALTPYIMTWLQEGYAHLGGLYGVTGTYSHAVRFFLALLALLIPTIMMGGTLPVLVKALKGYLPNLAEATGKLYGINTLGAAIGTFAAGYFLMPLLGISGTIYLTVIINFGVALGVWFMARSLTKQERRVKKKKKTKKKVKEPKLQISVIDHKNMIILMTGFVLSGFAALVYELAWIRSLTLVIGSSVYAFSTVLSTYLFGLAFGSLLYGRWSRTHLHSNALKTATYLEIGVALSAITGLFVIPMLPELFLQAFRAGLQENFALFQLYIFFLSFLLMIIPTILLGALFPLITSVWAAQSEHVGRSIGSAYALNTLGTIAGTIIGGLFLMQWIGVQYTLIFGGIVHMFSAALFWYAQPDKPREGTISLVVSVVLFALLVFILPSWDKAMMTSGVFSYGKRIAESKDKDALQKRADSRKILYYKEGLDGVVSVAEAENGNRMLIINGKIDASSKGDLPSQILAGAIPMLLHPDPEEVLIVGLGSGIMVGSVAADKYVKSIDLLEISEGVTEASDFFVKEHHDILKDPRVNLIVADARNYISATDKQYDLVISEPSNPWISGISNLFTQEYFSTASQKLKKGGLMMQWLQTYQMDSDDVKMIFHTFNSIYPHVSVWIPMGGDLVLIGSHEPHTLDLERLRNVMSQKTVKEDIGRIGIHNVSDLLQRYLIGGAFLKAYAKDAKINSDDHPYIEFNAPKNLYSDNTSLENTYKLTHFLDEEQQNVPVRNSVIFHPERFEIPIMELSIKHNKEIKKEDVSSGFQVKRQLLHNKKNNSSGILVTHSAYLLFDEGSDRFSVSTVYLKNRLKPLNKEQILQSKFPQGTLRRGTVQMPNGKEAIWMQKNSQTMNLGVLWSCNEDNNTKVLYHMATLERKDKSNEDIRDALITLTKRFECR